MPHAVRVPLYLILVLLPLAMAWEQGHLTHEGHADAPGIALIAGGVGIAPLLGILRELSATGDTRATALRGGPAFWTSLQPS